MKLLKSKLNESVKLVEEEGTTGSIDAGESTAEIAADLVKQTEEASDGTIRLDAGTAMQAATEIKDAAASLNTDEVATYENSSNFDPLGSDNELTRKLTKCFLAALKHRRRGEKTASSNLLVSGLPGSGKTASVYDWASSSKKIDPAGVGANIMYVNAKQDDLQAWINGYTARISGKDGESDHVSQLYSNNLVKLERPNSILFLDEYNRQSNMQIRSALYTLINEHCINGDDEDGLHYFKNLLFTIACINPFLGTDVDATPLNDAERSRFKNKLMNYDSDPRATADYLTKFYDKKIKSLDKNSPYYEEDLEEFLRIQDLGLHIVTHSKFAYDTVDDLADINRQEGTLLCQRVLCDALADSEGDPSEFFDWVENESYLLDKDIDMLREILRDYAEPSIDDLKRAKGIVDSDNKQVAPEAEVAEETPETAGAAQEENREDDEELFSAPIVANKADASGAIRVKSASEVERDIQNLLNQF